MSQDDSLWNEDLAPSTPSQRDWTWKNFTALWVGMVACIPTYMLASGLIETGFSPGQAIALVFAGNVIVLIPMLLVGAMGTAYGVPFPVFARSSFGPRGAQVVALARALVACGWFGINCWIGGSAIYAAIHIADRNLQTGSTMPILGITPMEFGCFLLFWGVHFYFIGRGTSSIRWLQNLAAPFLLAMGAFLLWWAFKAANGFGPMLDAQSSFSPGHPKASQLWPQVAASLTAMVGFWATLALNICDFTRFSRSQRDQLVGQTLGLPLPMALFSFIGVVVTSATIVIFGKAIWQPTELAARLGGGAGAFALAVICLCTLTVNMAANVVSPSYDFANLWPSRISFTGGGVITALIGIAIFPWKLLSSSGTYIYAWLVGYSALLGPIAGIMIADYYIVRGQKLITNDLFSMEGRYAGTRGWNFKGIFALLLGVAPNIPGFLHSVSVLKTVPPIFDTVFTGAWFVGFLLAGISYSIFNFRSCP